MHHRQLSYLQEEGALPENGQVLKIENVWLCAFSSCFLARAF